MPRRNSTREQVQAPKRPFKKVRGFWHAIADGLDYTDEVFITRTRWDR